MSTTDGDSVRREPLDHSGNKMQPHGAVSVGSCAIALVSTTTNGLWVKLIFTCPGIVQIQPIHFEMR